MKYKIMTELILKTNNDDDVEHGSSYITLKTAADDDEIAARDEIALIYVF